jgi:poly-gamma-glutamate capsule biosynthesis protein CapA/YwtB (metallophosphatase superfamily)
LTLINLEAPLIANCPPHSSGFVFCGQAGFVAALTHAGVDVAGLENNHIGNYGAEGVRATRTLLGENGIDFTDRSTLAVREVRGMRFGFLAFNGVGEFINRRAMVAAIEAARPQVDVLVVAFHWGAEYVSVPSTAPGIAPDDPVEIGHMAVDAGADLVVGNHPHWVQAVEVYQGELITYAHGNFIFDQSWSRPTSEGVVGRYTFYQNRLVKAEFLPVVIADESQPRFVAGAEGDSILTRMRDASRQLEQRLTGR